jgi:hypothetical protein
MFYRPPNDKTVRTREWSYARNDLCPTCNAENEPAEVEEIREDSDVDLHRIREAVDVLKSLTES